MARARSLVSSGGKLLSRVVSESTPAPAGLNLRLKIILAMAVVALVVVVAILFTTYRARQKQLLTEFQLFVRSIAGTTALALRGEDLAGIRTNEDASKPEFLRVRSMLARSRRINGLEEHEIYILRPIDTGRETEFVVMLQREPFIGNRYLIRDENVAPLLAAWQTLEPTSTGIYRDEHGTWISGYAPIVDARTWTSATMLVSMETVARQYGRKFMVSSRFVRLGVSYRAHWRTRRNTL